jgi:hypothetical protein
MTANELASQIEDWEYEIGTMFSKKIATMLRQQAQEIEELRIQIANEEESYMLLNEYCLCAKESNKQLTEKIGQLKKELALQRLSDIGQEIENEPVAHRFKWEEKMSWQYGDGYDATGAPNDPDYFAYEPLYTHPNEDRDSAIYATGYWKGIEYKRMRELTDEEIYKEMIKCIDEPEDGHTFRYKDFARAILKKASEK